MSLTEEELKRYDRHLRLQEVGVKGQEKLKSSSVLVVGAGGLGCPALLYLNAAGVGTIGIIDFDVVDLSNLHRQVLFNTSDIGENKAQVAKKKLTAQNSFVRCIAFDEKLTNKNALEIFSQFDVIIDGTDNFSTRYLVNDACVLLDKPLVYGAINNFEGQVSVFNYQGGPCYRCLFPEPPAPGSVRSCSEAGVLGVLPGIIGSQQANEALKIMLDIGETLSGRLLIYNALNASFNQLILENTTCDSAVKNSADFEGYNYDFFCGLEQVAANSISLKDFESLSSNTIVLDVREDWEQPKINDKNVLEIPLAELPKKHASIPVDTPVYVVCQKGGRSASAIEYLEKEFSFQNLINVSEGMLG